MMIFHSYVSLPEGTSYYGFPASDLGRPWRQLASRSGASVRAALRGVAAEAVEQAVFF